MKNCGGKKIKRGVKMYKCPKCGGTKIVIEGVEIYCLSKIHGGLRSGRPCLYHLSGKERRKYRGLIAKDKKLIRHPKNIDVTENDNRLALYEQKKLLSAKCKAKNPKYDYKSKKENWIDYYLKYG